MSQQNEEAQKWWPKWCRNCDRNHRNGDQDGLLGIRKPTNIFERFISEVRGEMCLRCSTTTIYKYRDGQLVFVKTLPESVTMNSGVTKQKRKKYVQQVMSKIGQGKTITCIDEFNVNRFLCHSQGRSRTGFRCIVKNWSRTHGPAGGRARHRTSSHGAGGRRGRRRVQRCWIALRQPLQCPSHPNEERWGVMKADTKRTFGINFLGIDGWAPAGVILTEHRFQF